MAARSAEGGERTARFATRNVGVDDVGRSRSFGRRIRAPAVAGVLYPADPEELAEQLGTLLDSAPPGSPAPKALIVPHGGLRYSGGAAGRAYGTLAPASESITRVVLVGPLHRSAIDGLVVPESDTFATPLGLVPVDVPAIVSLLALPFVRCWDVPHRREHSLEMQLPFLQLLVHRFRIVPVLVGVANATLVATALRRVWGGPETLVVATTDLSRQGSQLEAVERDRATATRIERFEFGLGRDVACGSDAIDGLLRVAEENGLQPRTLDLRTSADAGGDPSRVVGYGAFAFY